MKKYLFSLILLLVSYVGYSQKGLSYQAVILDPAKIEIPGQDISSQPLVNGDVWLKFSIFNGSTLQFEEVHKTKTDNYGLINLLIGSVSSASFNSLVWDSSQKSLQVFVSFNQGGSYTKISDQKLNYNPYTFYADAAGKLNGTLAIAGGGTGATTAADARANLGLDQVNNTSDAAKPVSTATKAALDLKANASDVTAALAVKANATDMTTALAAKADTSFVIAKVAAATIADADASTKGKIQLAGDLSGTAAAPTVPGLALKLNTSEKGVANGIATLNSSGIIPSNQLPPVTLSSTSVVASDAAMVALSNATVGSIAVRTDVNKNYVLSALPASTLANWIELLTPGAPVQTVNGYTGSVNLVKSDIGLANVDNTSDVNKQVSAATQTALNLKADTSSVRTALALKLNIADANAALNLKLDANKVGVANGTASLNALGKIPTDQIPAISFSSVKVLGSQAQMLALSSAVVGSVVIRTDVNKNYVLAQADPSVLTNWIELLTPAPPVQTVNGYTGSVSLTKSDLGLGSVNNTSDADKPISTATQIALEAKPSREFITSAISTGTATNTADIIALKTSVIANTQSITATKVSLAQKALLFKPLKNAEYVMPTSGILTDANSGNIIYSQWAQKPVFPESLSDGFYCTIVNYSGGAITSNTLSAARFYTNTSGYAGATTFTIPAGGSANVYALKINGAQRYYVSAGDQATAANVADASITNAKLAGSITSSKLVGTDITTLGTVTTGTWSGANIAITNGGTGANSAAGARINLGLEIGTNVMAANATTTLSGDVTGMGSGTFTTTLSNTGVTAGTFGSASTIPAITVDQKGRIIAASSFPISAGISSLLYTSATSYAAGGTISGTTLYLSAADASNPGLLSTSNQTIVGSKTFSSNVVANGTNVGKGSGGSSTVLGDAASANDNSTAIGFMALNGNGGTNNTAVGTNAMRNSSSTSYTTAVGVIAGQNDNTGNNNTFLGYAASVPNSSAISNSTAIGAGAIVTANNTMQLGADGSNGFAALQNVKTSGTLTAGAVTYPNTNGTLGQVLTANANGSASWTTVGGTLPTTVNTSANYNLVMATPANAALVTGTGNGGTIATLNPNTGQMNVSGLTVQGYGLTSPFYASTPQTLTDASTIAWNIGNGLNASVTLGGNRTLNFPSMPLAGSYGTLVVTQDATGGRTLTLPAVANKVLGSTSTTTVALSTAPGAKDILNFYYDGTTWYWNVDQGYGSTSTSSFTNIAGGAAGSIPYQTGVGATSLLPKGNNFSFLTLNDVGLPTWTNAIRATQGLTGAVGFSFIGGDWAKSTGMFSENPDEGNAMLKFRITGNSKLTIDPNNVAVVPNTASTSKTTGALTVAGGLGVNGDIYANKLILNSGTPGGASLEVNGASTNTTAFDAASGTSIDFTKSNLAYTSASAGNFTLTGMKNGGTYTLAVQGATSGTAAFTAAGLTLKSVNNAATTANKHTLYTFIVMGTTVYYSMMTGL